MSVLNLKNVEPAKNNDQTLRKFFEKFGRIIKVLAKPQNKTARVRFCKHHFTITSARTTTSH